VLLEKSLLADATMIPFHRDGTAADMWQHERRDGLVIRGELALGDPVVREQDLVRMRNHDISRTTSRADLSVRRPSKRECRSLPCAVHSMKAICATTSGRTQCARTRGNPTALVNGEVGISSASSRARSSSSSFVSKPVPTFPAKTKSSFSK